MILGVLGQNGLARLGEFDVFAAAAGGFAVSEPAADLAMALAIRSASQGLPLLPNVVALGEIGLGGEVRRVPGIERRLAEAARMGFTQALVPKGAVRGTARVQLHEVDDVCDAVAHAFAPHTEARTIGAVC